MSETRKPAARQVASARLRRFVPQRARVVVEDRIHVLHRVVARTAVYGLLERVRADESEALEHERVLEVYHREHARRNRPRRVADRAAQVPFRLRVLRPLDVAERMRELELRRTADLALHHVERARVRLNQPAERFDARSV